MRLSAWERALKKFLVPIRRKKFVLGAVLTGSRAAGTDTARSDIDVHIVLSKDVTWRERGNKVIDGFLIEYFMNPLRQLEEYRKDDFKSGFRIDARMFSTGRVLFDKTGDVERVKKRAERDFRRPLKKLDRASTELGKYFLWDELDNLLDLHDAKSPICAFAYALLLNRVVDTYRRYLGAEITTPSKLYRLFTDSAFRQRYRIEKFPDQAFVQQFLECLQDRSPEKIQQLAEHVQRKMGGFKIDPAMKPIFMLNRWSAEIHYLKKVINNALWIYLRA